MKKELFRSLVKWFGILLVLHFAAMLLFWMTVSSTAKELADHSDTVAEAYRVILIFDLIVWGCFSVGSTIFESSFMENRNELKQIIREKKASAPASFFQAHWKECVGRIALVGFVQMPFLIFFACFDFSLVAITGFEEFYILDAGMYAVTQIPILGWILNVLSFGGIWFAVYFLGYLWNHKRMKKELSDLH